LKQLSLVIAMLILIGVSNCRPELPPGSPITPTPNPTGAVFSISPNSSRLSLQSQLDTATIDKTEVVVLLPPDTISAVLPEQALQILVTAAEANAMGMKPSERVIGATIHGNSRAYPLPFMSDHEIVNDVIGGRPVAITW
jgi:hypothetical protein